MSSLTAEAPLQGATGLVAAGYCLPPGYIVVPNQIPPEHRLTTAPGPPATTRAVFSMFPIPVDDAAYVPMRFPSTARADAADAAGVYSDDVVFMERNTAALLSDRSVRVFCAAPHPLLGPTVRTIECVAVAEQPATRTDAYFLCAQCGKNEYSEPVHCRFCRELSFCSYKCLQVARSDWHARVCQAAAE